MDPRLRSLGLDSAALDGLNKLIRGASGADANGRGSSFCERFGYRSSDAFRRTSDEDRFAFEVELGRIDVRVRIRFVFGIVTAWEALSIGIFWSPYVLTVIF